MKQKILLVGFLFSLFMVCRANKQDEVTFFARIIPEQNALFVGDSCLVNIVLYSSHPFSEVKSSPERLRVKNGHVRLLPHLKLRAQERVIVDNKIFYAMVWQRFVVSSDKKGEIRFASMKFIGEFMADEASTRLLEQFFGGLPHTPQKIRSNCKLPVFSLPVKPRPKRSTQQMMSASNRVA